LRIVVVVVVVDLGAGHPACAVHWLRSTGSATATDETNAHQKEEEGEQNDAENDPATPRAECAVCTSATTKGVVVAPGSHDCVLFFLESYSVECMLYQRWKIADWRERKIRGNVEIPAMMRGRRQSSNASLKRDLL